VFLFFVLDEMVGICKLFFISFTMLSLVCLVQISSNYCPRSCCSVAEIGLLSTSISKFRQWSSWEEPLPLARSSGVCERSTNNLCLLRPKKKNANSSLIFSQTILSLFKIYRKYDLYDYIYNSKRYILNLIIQICYHKYL